jgi:protein TonB
MVIVSFIVAKDGSITNTKIEKSLNLDCDKEAIRLVKSMPRWIPGDPVRYYLPIQFSPPQE